MLIIFQLLILHGISDRWITMQHWWTMWENWTTGRKTCPSALCPPQIPHGLIWDWTQASTVVGWWLTAWAMAWPKHGSSWTNPRMETVMFLSVGFNCTKPLPLKHWFLYTYLYGIVSGKTDLLQWTQLHSPISSTHYFMSHSSIHYSKQRYHTTLFTVSFDQH